MNKNLLLGALGAIVLVGLGYYFFQQSKVETAYESQTGATPPAPNIYITENVPPSTPPPAPLPPKADAPTVETDQNVSASDSTAIVAGKVKPNGASTKYWFEYGESTALGSRSTAQAVGSGFTLISAPAYIMGLRANTLYYFRLSAQNSFATVNGGTYTFRTNSNPPPKATAPTTRTTSATEISRTTANVNGEVNPNGSEAVYWFEYGKDTNFGNVTALQSGGDGTVSTVISSSLSSLEPATKYYFRLNAQNKYGTINGGILNFTTQGPPAPISPTVTTTEASNLASTSATLMGHINPNGAETTYWFEYSKDSLLGSLIGNGTAPITLDGGSAVVTARTDVSNLQPDTKYFYRLVGKNSAGTSRGDIISFRTKQK